MFSPLYKTALALLLSTSLLVQADELAPNLTPNGANAKPNADKSIPAWSGGVDFPNWVKGDKAVPDPYPNEKPLFSITAANADEYKDKLSVGALTLLEKFPERFRMDIYPSHRDFRYTPDYEARTQWNLGKTALVNGVDGIQNITGGIPFAKPQNGAEVMWNARLSQPVKVADSMIESVAVFPGGKIQTEKSRVFFETPLAYETHPVGTKFEELGTIAGYMYGESLEPARKRGEKIVIHEPIDQQKHKRKAWVYIPGAKRVKQTPSAAYDTPMGPGGLMTVDDAYGFNGPMDRFNWTLVGKKEMYVPYSAYRFDNSELPFNELLPAGHPNPDLMRYELHRVWIVEAHLKDGKRHIYKTRRFYIDEDSWLILMTESYDGRDELYRIGFQNTIYHPAVNAYVSRVYIQFDLTANAYVAAGLINRTRPTDYNAKAKGPKFFTSNNLKKLGRR